MSTYIFNLLFTCLYLLPTNIYKKERERERERGTVKSKTVKSEEREYVQRVVQKREGEVMPCFFERKRRYTDREGGRESGRWAWAWAWTWSCP